MGFFTDNSLASYPYKNILKAANNIQNEPKQATPSPQLPLPFLLPASMSLTGSEFEMERNS